MTTTNSRATREAIVLSSGGKDSILALHMAAEMGYRLAGLLTIVPSDPKSALNRSRNSIHVRGIARSVQLPYWSIRARPGDEEGALTQALQRLQPPTVVTGTIASSLQLAWFTHVAAAAGARVYAPLWGFNAPQVFAEMVRRRIDAVVVAVAEDGLGAEWLGTHLTEANVARLQTLEHGDFDQTGEGGDIDTFVLDGPLYTRRLRILAAEKERRGDYIALRIRRLASVPKRGARKLLPREREPRNSSRAG